MIEGGVSRAQYCNTLAMIITHNPFTSAMGAAWGTHCAPYGVKYFPTERVVSPSLTPFTFN
jgi:hypothetical protein